MIRIDEIYNNTFWPWLEKNKPGTRLFFCDPPGSTSPDSLFNLSSDDIAETDYVWMHDQEPCCRNDSLVFLRIVATHAQILPEETVLLGQIINKWLATPRLEDERGDGRRETEGDDEGDGQPCVETVGADVVLDARIQVLDAAIAARQPCAHR